MKKKKIFKKIIITIVFIFLASFIGFVIYAMDYMHADNTALNISNSNSVVALDNGDYVLESEKNIGIIFYPGAKVEEEAYLPLLEKLNKQGYNCFLIKMPLRFAFLGINKADYYIKEYTEIDTWYMAGHSLGGAMASSYASKNDVEGLILLGAYIYGDINPTETLTIYGENDLNLDKTKLGSTNVFMIDGGNHAAFGNYGKQKGDGELLITREKQQDIAVDIIVNFIEKDN